MRVSLGMRFGFNGWGGRVTRLTRNWIPTPYITETVGGGWHTYEHSGIWRSGQADDIFSRLLKERIITVCGEIDDELSAKTVAQLLYLDADTTKKSINMYINSPGGSVTAGLAIYDTMNYVRSSVRTICLGQAASMASLLLCAGEAGQRFSLPHASIMLHQPSGGYYGKASDIELHTREIVRMRTLLNGIYAKHFKKAGKQSTAREIDELLSKGDHFMTPQQAMELGVVDAVLTGERE